MLAGAAPFDLNKVGWREDRTEEAKVQNVRAVVACGHHTDGDADASLAGLVPRDEVRRAEQVVVGEVDRVLLRAVHLRGDLHREVGLVFAWEHEVGDFVQNLGELAGMVLTDRKDNGLADLTADGVAKGVVEEGLAEELIGRRREEPFLELTKRYASS